MRIQGRLLDEPFRCKKPTAERINLIRPTDGAQQEKRRTAIAAGEGAFARMRPQVSVQHRLAQESAVRKRSVTAIERQLNGRLSLLATALLHALERRVSEVTLHVRAQSILQPDRQSRRSEGSTTRKCPRVKFDALSA